MPNFKVGDMVIRKSYGGDVLFKVTRIKFRNEKKICELKGICCRLAADAPAEDLEIAPATRIADEIRKRSSGA